MQNRNRAAQADDTALTHLACAMLGATAGLAAFSFYIATLLF